MVTVGCAPRRPRRWCAGVALALSVWASVAVRVAGQAASSVERGEINGAAYRIEIPPDWNRGLVLYAHGYALAGAPYAFPEDERGKGLREVFLSRHFAFAESAYAAQGWAVKEGIEDTEALRRHFVARHGAPSETFITGHSMGGHITIATIERFANEYQGRCPCAVP